MTRIWIWFSIYLASAFGILFVGCGDGGTRGTKFPDTSIALLGSYVSQEKVTARCYDGTEQMHEVPKMTVSFGAGEVCIQSGCQDQIFCLIDASEHPLSVALGLEGETCIVQSNGQVIKCQSVTLLKTEEASNGPFEAEPSDVPNTK